MNRRDLLKRAAVVPMAALGTLLVSGAPAEAGGSSQGTLIDIFPGGFGPESQNGGDIVIKVKDPNTGLKKTVLVDKKTSIRIGGVKIKYRALLGEVYTNQQTLLFNLYGDDVVVSFRTGLKAKTIDLIPTI
jgi:hypothetical protein